MLNRVLEGFMPGRGRSLGVQGQESERNWVALAVEEDDERTKRDGAAIEAAQESLDAARRTGDEASPQFVNCLGMLARCYDAQGRYREAEPVYLHALALLEQSTNSNRADTARIQHDLGVLYCTLGRHTEAEDYLGQSLTTREEAHGPTHPDVADCLFQLGRVYRIRAQYVEAEIHYRLALDIRKETLGDGHISAGESMSGLAELYTKLGDYVRAEPLHQEVLDLLVETPDLCGLVVAECLSHVATYCIERGRTKEAAQYLDSTLCAVRDSVGLAHPGAAEHLSKLGHVYTMEESHAKAQVLYEIAGALDEGALGPSHLVVGMGLANLAQSNANQGRCMEAIPLLERALIIVEKALGPDHPDLAGILIVHGDLYRLFGEYVRAEARYVRAERLLEAKYGPESTKMGTVLNNLGVMYHDSGRYDDGRIRLERALPLLEARFGPSHPQTSRCRENLRWQIRPTSKARKPSFEMGQYDAVERSGQYGDQ